MRLSLADLQTLVGLLERLYVVEDLADFPTAVVEVARALVPGTVHAYNEVDTARGHVAMTVEPAVLVTPERQAVIDRHLGEHPVIAYHASTGDGRALAISDFLGRDEFRRSTLYQALYSQIDGEDQLSIANGAPSTVIGVAINRDRWRFSARDRLLLDLLRPHLAIAHRNATELTLARRAVEASGVRVVRLAPDWRIADADDAARSMLARSFDRWSASSDVLPGELRAWAREQADRLAADPSAPLAPLLVEQSGVRLTVRFVPGTPYAGATLTLKAEERGLSAVGAHRLMLSPRETEVPRLVADGASDAEIAESLVISRHTVHRHLQNLYARLGVRGRSAAVAKVRAAALDA